MPRPAKHDKVKQMQVGEVIHNELAANAVEEDNIKNGAVTNDKLGTSAVNLDKVNTAMKTYALSYKHEGSADTAETDWERTMFVVPFAGELVDADITTDTGFGQDTNYSSLSVVNKGQNGSGTTSMAAKDFNATNATTAYKSHLITLSGVTGARTVAEGDVISIKKTHSGNGQTVPDHAITLKFTRTA